MQRLVQERRGQGQALAHTERVLAGARPAGIGESHGFSTVRPRVRRRMAEPTVRR